MPSGASNVGVRVLGERFPDMNKGDFSRSALFLAPTSLFVYPLIEKGERFPFNYPEAEKFCRWASPQPARTVYSTP